MGKIIGDPNVIALAKNAPAGAKNVYVNFDAAENLSDDFEILITKLDVNIGSDFTDLKNGKLLPKTELLYEIARVCGISGGDKSISEPIIQEVDINPMLMKPLEDAPTYRKMTIGHKVVKYSTRLQEDGTLLKSTPCTCEYNVWQRINETWSKEELYSEGYTKPSKSPPKYDNKYKRKSSFDAEMKFAQPKAETKAYLKSIRELVGLQTGYSSGDLSSGYLIFSKVRRSKEALQAETAARLSHIANGEKVEDNLLFEKPEPAVATQEPVLTPEPIVTHEPVTTPDPEPAQEQPGTMREMLMHTLTKYSDIIQDEQNKSNATNIINWLDKTPTAENEDLWPRAIGILKLIESGIPDAGKIKHNLY